MQSPSTRHAAWLAVAFVLPLLALAACADEPARTLAPEAPGTERPAPRALGLVEITITGIGQGGSPAASVLSAGSLAALEHARPSDGQPRRNDGNPALAPLQSLPGNADLSGDGTLQLEPVSTGSFTVGRRGEDGYRYVYATYRVRNAQKDSTAYDTDRQNLTFYAVDTDGTLGETAISRLDRFDGSAATVDPATILPTGAVTLDVATGEVVSAAPDVLQVLDEDEASDLLELAVAGTATVFPYGFVVRNPSDATSRTLPANPDADQFDGLVTFAFKIPLAASPADDPFTVSAIFMAVDESDVVVTQSLEEQTAQGQAAFEARAGALGADRITLLPGGAYGGARPSRKVCSVRTAGTAGTPLAFLVDAARSFDGLTADAYGPAGTSIARNARISAEFSDGTVTRADARTFVVHGMQSGRHFVHRAYDGNGTATITTPAGTFFPGEEVEVTLTDGLGHCAEPELPRVTRLRVAAAAGSASFTRNTDVAVDHAGNSTILADVDGDGRLDFIAPSLTNNGVGVWANDGNMTGPTVIHTALPDWPAGMAVGDLDGDGTLDLAAALDSDQLAVRFGTGDGTFAGGSAYPLAGAPNAVALGDLNADGWLDVVVALPDAGQVAILLGNGDGTFQAPANHPVGGYPIAIALADVNHDGKLDLLTGEGDDGFSITLSLGDGNGGFDAPSTIAVGEMPMSIAAADLDGDGVLDLAVANSHADSWTDGTISIRIGNGDGTFQNWGEIPMTGRGPTGGVAAGDLDGDGDLDLVAANFVTASVTLLVNDGNGNFHPAADIPANMPIAISLGDLDGDGALDIVVSSGAGSGSTTVLWNN